MFSVGYREKEESLEMMKSELIAHREKYRCDYLDWLISIADELLGHIYCTFDDPGVPCYEVYKEEYFENGFNWLVNHYLHYIKDPGYYIRRDDPDYDY